MPVPPPRPDDDAGRCPTCRYGCGCQVGSAGCEHYGCHARHLPATCPGAAVEEARYAAAQRQTRATQARALNRRAGDAAILRAATEHTRPR